MDLEANRVYYMRLDRLARGAQPLGDQLLKLYRTARRLSAG